MKERNMFIIKLLASHVFLVPFVLIIIPITKIPLFPAVLIPQTILGILFLAGYWEFFGTRTKFLICLIDEIMILITIFSGFAADNTISHLSILILLLFEFYLLLHLGKVIWVIFRKDKEKFEVEFPFGKGKYLISDGGNSKISRLMNYHFHSPVHMRKNTNSSMLYATDIVKLGDKYKNFLPRENSDYPIFGENIYCPAEGLVVRVINDIEDNIPYSGNYPYNTGNTVVIKNANYYLLLGHLKKGSIVVKTGDTINRKKLIGKAGNSGMSERPHLHMQLMQCEGEDYWKGEGISMQFREKNLYKNRLIRH